ncbi:MAG TPA: tetraacyldisaccharide 4'-kinase [Candidatus Acidoferrum sp.]|nr:tetraacyldisaccharide 4'-kinase [Candidatus Acidoferrum sp.]
MQQTLSSAWYRKAWWLWLLWPLSLLYGALFAWQRRRALRRGRYQSKVPVIVVGNITAGGTGKTPLCIALARHYTALGRKVVLVSRGYGGKATQFPLLVTAATDPREAGDEAVLLAIATHCTVVVDPDRVRAVRQAEQMQAQLIISDDGLQHHRLQGSVEVLVIDGERGLGNGLLLPAGPLREPVRRLGSVDVVVSNGPLTHALPIEPKQAATMQLAANSLTNLQTGEQLSIAEWQTRHGAATRVHAVAGIGNPQRFFASLRGLGFVIMPHAFDDHHAFQPGDLAFAGQTPVVMTAKDAVKCRRFAQAQWWLLEVEALLTNNFFVAVDEKLRGN